VKKFCIDTQLEGIVPRVGWRVHEESSFWSYDVEFISWNYSEGDWQVAFSL